MSFITETARTYDPDPAHNKQVTTLALALFDGLRTLHEYGLRERRLLEIAGRLHDIGWSRVVTGKHHKLSRDMILELNIPGIDGQDQLSAPLLPDITPRPFQTNPGTGGSGHSTPTRVDW